MSVRPLRLVDASEPLAVRDALAAAIAGGAPILPRSIGAISDAPGTASRESLVLDASWPDDACLVIETSGSTASPKRVVLTACSLRASGVATAARLDELAVADGRSPGAASAQWLLCLPAGYVAGAQVLARSILAGTEPVISAPARFDPVRFAADVERMQAGWRLTSFVPAQLIRLLEAAEAGDDADAATRIRDAVASFDAILVGGQSTPPPVRARAAALGWRLVTTYGASETSGGCVYNGEPLDGVEPRVVDGEVWLAGEVLAAGYLGDDDRTGRTFVVDGGRRWYRTGDAGRVESRGPRRDAQRRLEGTRQRLVVTGRLDNVIISGGEKVLLDHVEQLVRAVDGYADAVVVAVPSATWGEVPAVVIVDRHVAVPAADSDAALDADAGWGRVRDAAAVAGRAAKPAHRIRITELPRLVSGKPDRRELAAIAARAVTPA